MRDIHTRKGLTLVEIVIAVAILAILSSIFGEGMVSHFRRLHDTKRVTENAFYAAREVEHEMQDIKRYLAGLPVPTPIRTTTSRVMFNSAAPLYRREITYYPVTHLINNLPGNSNPPRKTVHCVVADVRPPEFEVPIITNNNAYIVVTPVGNVVANAYAANITNSHITIETDVTVDKQHLLQTVLYQWYRTNSSFPMRWNEYTDLDDPGIGRRVALVLGDFQIIPGATSRTLSVNSHASGSNSVAGQHVVCLMTPASFDGKMGRSVPTRPVYIYGLPVTNNLMAHYDASLIDLPNSDFDDIALGGRVALRWRNISNNSNVGNANNVVGGQSPWLYVEEFPQLSNRNYPIHAQYVRFGDRGLFDVNLAFFGPFTIFAVVRLTGPNRMILGVGNNLGFNAASFPGLVQDEWYILGINSGGTRTVGKNANPSSNNTAPVFGGGPVRIGGSTGTASNIDLAELIIYNNLVPSADWLKITQYLGRKYNID